MEASPVVLRYDACDGVLERFLKFGELLEAVIYDLPAPVIHLVLHVNYVLVADN